MRNKFSVPDNTSFNLALIFLLVILSLYTNVGWTQNPDEMKTTFRGKYFSKTVYTPSPIPEWEKSIEKLPQPILPARKDYINLYYKAWEMAFSRFKRPPEGSPFVSDFIDEAFAPQIFQWDTVFMIEFARYAHHIFPSIKSLDNFYSRQWEDGFIHREIREADGFEFWFEGSVHAVNPPLFAWTEWEYQKLAGKSGRIYVVYPALVKYAEWLEKNRKREGTIHQLYWNTGLGSGMDNTPRSGSGWVDMSAQMALMYNSLAEMADVLNKPADKVAFKARADSIGARINRFMWSAEDRIYYDVDDQGNQVKVKTVAGFWPMLAGIASDKQVEKLIDELRNPKTFWRPVPFPSLSLDHPKFEPDGKYWLGSVWAPTNVMVLKGLDRYSHVYPSEEFSAYAAGIYLDAMVKVFESTGTIWENYSSEQFTRGGWSKPDFVGWSGCGPIQLLIENIIGIKPDALKNSITWNITRIDEHGIKNLTFEDQSISMIVKKRKNVMELPSIEISAEKQFDLILRINFTSYRIKVQPGKVTFSGKDLKKMKVEGVNHNN